MKLLSLRNGVLLQFLGCLGISAFATDPEIIAELAEEDKIWQEAFPNSRVGQTSPDENKAIKPLEFQPLTDQAKSDASLDPMYWLNRNVLPLVSHPVLEVGLLIQLAQAYRTIMNLYFTGDKRVSRSTSNQRVLMRKLKEIAEDSLCYETLSSPTRAPQHLLRSMAKGCLLVQPILPLLGQRQATRYRRPDWSTLRYKTYERLGMHRTSFWGSISVFDELGDALQKIDSVSPFDVEFVGGLYALFQPINSEAKWEKTRRWEITRRKRYNTVISNILTCINAKS